VEKQLHITDAKIDMKCHGCSSLMVLDKQETGTGSCTRWHSCPLCGKVRLTSQPESGLEDTVQEGQEDQADQYGASQFGQHGQYAQYGYAQHGIDHSDIADSHDSLGVQQYIPT